MFFEGGMLANQPYSCTSVCVYVCACGVSVWEQGQSDKETGTL